MSLSEEDPDADVVVGADLKRSEPESLALLLSEECGDGRLSVSELWLGPPREGRRSEVNDVRRDTVTAGLDFERKKKKKEKTSPALESAHYLCTDLSSISNE